MFLILDAAYANAHANFYFQSKRDSAVRTRVCIIGEKKKKLMHRCAYYVRALIHLAVQLKTRDVEVSHAELQLIFTKKHGAKDLCVVVSPRLYSWSPFRQPWIILLQPPGLPIPQ